MARIIPLKRVLFLGEGSEFYDEISDPAQDEQYGWPGENYDLDLTMGNPNFIRPVWIGVSEDLTTVKPFPIETSVAAIKTAGWPKVYQGTEIFTVQGDVNVFSNQYAHVMLAFAACCATSTVTNAFALKQSNFSLAVDGPPVPCGAEAIFKWLAVRGTNEEQNTSYAFHVEIRKPDNSIILTKQIDGNSLLSTYQTTVEWPAQFLGITFDDDITLIPNDQEPDEGQYNLSEFDNGIITVAARVYNTDTEAIISESIASFILPGTDCGGDEEEEFALRLLFNDIENAPANTLEGWNDFFNTADNADAQFDRLEVSENEVLLFGAEGLRIAESLFSENPNILRVLDEAECVDSVEVSAFNLSALEVVILPVCTILGAYAFAACENLTVISFQNVQSIGPGCFQSCSVLPSANFPSCTIINAYAFHQCSSLTATYFPLVTTTGQLTFGFCTSLSEINLPSCTVLASGFAGGTFSGCQSLISTNFPLVEDIGSACFDSCISLQSLYLPSCTNVGYASFHNCAAMVDLSIPACLTLGQNVDENNVFGSISGNVIQLTIPVALMTVNGGDPDGDILELQGNNTVTIVTV